MSVAAIIAARLARRAGIKGFGNARDARNKVDEAIKAWEARVGPAVVEAQASYAMGGEGRRGFNYVLPPVVEAQAGKRAMSARQYRSLTREDVLGRVPDLQARSMMGRGGGRASWGAPPQPQ